MPPASRRSSAARTLTHDRVVEEAAALVDEAGVDALNMRVLAERLGVSAMTPYRFVGSKEQLLARLADRYMGEVELPTGTVTWEDRVREVFRSVRRVLLRHPALAAIVATQRVNGLSSYRGAEVVLAALDEAGLPDDVAVSAFASLTAFTVGFAQREVAGAQDQLPERMATLGLLRAGEFPHVTRSAAELLSRDSEQHFETGLNLLIIGIKGVAR